MTGQSGAAGGRRAFCSWSGGKDSCLALARARAAGLHIERLFTMLDETGSRSRSHGLRPELLQAQADALGLPLTTRNASWADYEREFGLFLNEAAEAGLSAGVFGDIDLQPHREWEERVCGRAGLAAVLPLWQGVRRELLAEFLAQGFRAVIVALDAGRMDGKYLGRELSLALAEELEALGVDACGENGEFHTAVVAGPFFAQPLAFEFGETVERRGYLARDLKPVARAN